MAAAAALPGMPRMNCDIRPDPGFSGGPGKGATTRLGHTAIIPRQFSATVGFSTFVFQHLYFDICISTKGECDGVEEARL